MVRERVRPRREDVREGVLAAARLEFTEAGYARTSLARIAERAGFTKGAVYSNFASKQELMAEVASADFRLIPAELFVKHLPAQDSTWQELATGVVDAVIDEIQHNALVHTFLAEFAVEAARDPQLRETYGRMRERQRVTAVEALGPWIEQIEGVSGDDLDRMFGGVIALVTGFVVERAVLGDTPTVEQMRGALLAQLRVQVPTVTR